VRRVKMVCTLGPAVATPDQIHALVTAGMDVSRLNMSHGDHGVHDKSYEMVRSASLQTGRPVAILADLQGPKIRLGKFPDGPVKLKAGREWTITTVPVPGTVERASTTYAGLPGDVIPGSIVLVDDGRVRLLVKTVTGDSVVTEVVVGGKVSDNKGINLPGVAVSVPALSEKDVADLRWALRRGVDLIALSFVRNASDVEDVHRVMAEEGVFVPVLAKIEKPQALVAIDEIIDAFDGIMVARGDLGVECPLEDVPILQKSLIERSRRQAKPVIVATQMLESMITAPAPTRAEASDVANAVLDGADAVMLSGETAVGEYPIEAVEVMGRIISSTEAHGVRRMSAIDWQPKTRGGVIAKAAAEVAERVGARYLVAFTTSGDSARRLSRYRGRIPILAFTTKETVRSQLSVTWGVEAFLAGDVEHTDEMVRQVDESLLAMEHVTEGELVVIIAGSPPGIAGSTNALRIHRIGDAINGVAPAYRRMDL
jgi:pyruvate kinase